MGDLPGPEKPLDLGNDGHKLNANQLMAEFRAKIATGAVPVKGPGRPNGAGGSGPYNGRSGRFLKGRVKERHKMVVYLQAAGWKNNEIASAMGYTESRVSVILNSKRPELQMIKEDASKRVMDNVVDLQAKFSLHAPDALSRMVEIMEQTGDVANARLAAKDILDRAGYSPVKKTATINATVPFEQLAGTLSEIEKANEAASRRDEWIPRGVEVHQIKDGAA